MRIEDLIVLEYARRRGIPEEKAREWLEALRESEGDERAKKLQELLAILGDSAETLSKLPGELRGPAAAIVASQIGASLGSSGIEERLARAVERAAELKAVLSALGDSDPRVEELRRELQDIKNSLLELAREREEREKSQLAEALNRLLERMDELEERISTLESGPRDGSRAPEDPASIIIRASEEAEKLRRALEALGFKVERRGYNLEEILRDLEKMGFEVKRRYITPEELEEIKKRIEEETRRKLEVEMGIEQQRLQLIGTIIRDVLNNLITRVAEAWLETRREEVLSRLRARIAEYTGGGGEPGAPGEEQGEPQGGQGEPGGGPGLGEIGYTILGGGPEGGGSGEEGG